jgi:hypothetical protein
MRAIQGIGNWILVIMATASLVSMIAAFRLDMVVNQDLYSHGLQFSTSWAFPYWDAIRTVFAMAWLNIIVAIAFQIYRIIIVRQSESSNEQENMTKETVEHKNMDRKIAEKKLHEYTAETAQAASSEAKEDLQMIPYETSNCEQTESKATEQAEGQKETISADSAKEETSQEENQSEDSQVAVRWATDETESQTEPV